MHLCSVVFNIATVSPGLTAESIRQLRHQSTVDHISPALTALHRLPLSHRAHFIIVLMVYKACRGPGLEVLRTHCLELQVGNDRQLSAFPSTLETFTLADGNITAWPGLTWAMPRTFK